MNGSRIFLVIAAGAVLGSVVACLFLAPPAGSPASSPVAPAPSRAAPQPAACNTSYTRHEVTAPYPEDKNSTQPPFTLAPDEFSAALRGLGIASVCVPEGADAPYVKFDSKVFPAGSVNGRMVVYGFDGWREGQIVYSTYDIRMPTEYDTFATAADYEAMQNASAPGFERIKVGLCYGRCTVYRTFVFPFADHYVAATLDLGAYEYGGPVEEQVRKFTAGEYPPELQESLRRFEALAGGMEFVK